MELSKQNEKLEKKNEELDSHMVNKYTFEKNCKKSNYF